MHPAYIITYITIYYFNVIYFDFALWNCLQITNQYPAKKEINNKNVLHKLEKVFLDNYLQNETA